MAGGDDERHIFDSDVACVKSESHRIRNPEVLDQIPEPHHCAVATGARAVGREYPVDNDKMEVARYTMPAQ